MKRISFFRKLFSHKRVVIHLCILGVIVSIFWFISRYPALIHEGERAYEGTLTERNLGRITKDELMSTHAGRQTLEDSAFVIIAKTSVNWFYTNRVGMSFGILFGGGFLALFSSLSLKKGLFCLRGWKGAFIGLVSGIPLGVCANCVAPIGLSFRKKGVSIETTLASMLSSPMLNIVALYIAFSVFSFDLAFIKVVATFILILIVVPLISVLVPQKAGVDSQVSVGEMIELQETWGHALFFSLRSFLFETVKLIALTLPLMILAGILGGVMAVYIPLELFIRPETNQFVLVVLASVLGTLLPIPMLVDVILVLSLIESGLSRGLAMALLITLPAYSIFSASILWQYVSKRLAVAVFVAVTCIGILGGLTVMGLDYVALRMYPRIYVDILKDTPMVSNGPGSGVSWADYDGDGKLDLLVVGGKKDKNIKLYKNMGNDTFVDVTKDAGIHSPSIVSAGIFGDYDNDGCPDLYLSMASNSTDRIGNRDMLFHNTCKGTFVDVSSSAGMLNTYHATGAAWGDYDNDGYLDVYVTNIGADIGNKTHVIEPNILYHNNGNGTFTNRIDAAGASGNAQCPKKIYDTGKKQEFTLVGETREKLSYQPVWFDYNNDGKLDLFIATDTGVSPLYKNNGDGTFVDVTNDAGLCRFATGMGVAVGDYNRDGYLDLFVTNTGEYFLWKNNGNGTFANVARKLGISRNLLGWGTGFLDLDNDGNIDIYAVNGIVGDAYSRRSITYFDDFLFRNNGDGTFADVTFRSGLYGNEPKTGAAFGDYNNDGFVDVFIVSDAMREKKSSQINRFYKNRGNGNYWITLKLVGIKSNRDGVGATVKLTTQGNAQTQQVISGSSFYSQNSSWLTFGLKDADRVDTINVFWPSGIRQSLSNISSNQKITIVERE
ncbi:VCBS repeat-containing protein [Candidatus Gottesmanbacteria bacterium]|nr:VCBS repeat-containing protein [Candidatus Gottesmanbacteria bacterium]